MPRRKVLEEAQLEYWADRFVEHGLSRYMTFIAFMRDPDTNWQEIMGGEYRPLLESQAAVAASVEADSERLLTACDGLEAALDAVEQSVAEMRRNNGRYYERLKHHRVAS